MKKVLIATAALFALTGCAGAVPWNPQGYSGIDEVEITFSVPDSVHGPETLRITGGKEASNIAFSFVLPDGTEMSFSAADVRAFEGQKLRAAVEEAVSDDVKVSSPGIIDSILKAITGAM